jgi:hypothetical protein
MPGNSESLFCLFENMRKELEHLSEERMNLSKRIAILKNAMIHLVRFSGDEALMAQAGNILDLGERPRKQGLTQLCRSVLLESCEPLTTREVHDKVSDHVKHHHDGLASVTTILYRLVSYGEVERVRNDRTHECAWQWVQDRGNPVTASTGRAELHG